MHVLAFNSVTTLLNYFLEQLKETPSGDSIKLLQEETVVSNENKVCLIAYVPNSLVQSCTLSVTDLLYSYFAKYLAGYLAGQLAC